MTDLHSPGSQGEDIGAEKHPWITPKVTELPRLTDLTLFTGNPIDGDGGTGGTTVF